jgi:hypothetical protein
MVANDVSTAPALVCGVAVTSEGTTGNIHQHLSDTYRLSGFQSKGDDTHVSLGLQQV